MTLGYKKTCEMAFLLDHTTQRSSLTTGALWLCSQTTWVPISSQPPRDLVTLGKLSYCSVPQFPHPLNGEDLEKQNHRHTLGKHKQGGNVTPASQPWFKDTKFICKKKQVSPTWVGLILLADASHQPVWSGRKEICRWQ